MDEHASAATPEYTALRILAEPLIGHAVAGEALARMIERVTRKDAVLPDVEAELDRLYAS